MAKGGFRGGMGGGNMMSFGKSNAKVYICLLYTSPSPRD